jgi:hypothetical protein
MAQGLAKLAEEDLDVLAVVANARENPMAGLSLALMDICVPEETGVSTACILSRNSYARLFA